MLQKQFCLDFPIQSRQIFHETDFKVNRIIYTDFCPAKQYFSYHFQHIYTEKLIPNPYPLTDLGGVITISICMSKLCSQSKFRPTGLIFQSCIKEGKFFIELGKT